MKEWVWANWEKWMDEKPPWFNEKIRSLIPVEMIPNFYDQKIIASERDRLSEEREEKRSKKAGKKSKKRRAGSNMSSSLFGRFTTALLGKSNKPKISPGDMKNSSEDSSILNQKRLIAMGRRASISR